MERGSASVMQKEEAGRDEAETMNEEKEETFREGEERKYSWKQWKLKRQKENVLLKGPRGVRPWRDVVSCDVVDGFGMSAMVNRM